MTRNPDNFVSVLHTKLHVDFPLTNCNFRVVSGFVQYYTSFHLSFEHSGRDCYGVESSWKNIADFAFWNYKTENFPIIRETRVRAKLHVHVATFKFLLEADEFVLQKFATNNPFDISQFTGFVLSQRPRNLVKYYEMLNELTFWNLFVIAMITSPLEFSYSVVSNLAFSAVISSN